MNYEKALELAKIKLEWQTKQKYRDYYTESELNKYATQIYLLQNQFDGRG